MKRKMNMLSWPAAIVFMVSCATYPAMDTRLEEDLVDITKYDVGTDFTQFKTFSIVDSVSVISDKDSLKILDAQAGALLNQITVNMQARGYAKVNRKTSKPHLGINVGVVKTTNVSYYYPGWYWDYGYYDPSYWGYYGYNYYYPYYPPTVSSYSIGTVIIEMLDLKNAPAHDNKLYVVWVAAIRGLMTGYHTTQDILGNVDQCFAQTPQIWTNQ
ncbi:MAG: DUF4136 domain-containing protein [Bacteroidetes bacterium]|nr:DUF4136 domain-containing protein [Bacteroidota bacterium]